MGDLILAPWVGEDVDRGKPQNREMWEIRKRVFNARDMKDYITLVVRERPLTPEEAEFVPLG